mgnify:FL=1
MFDDNKSLFFCVEQFIHIIYGHWVNAHRAFYACVYCKATNQYGISHTGFLPEDPTHS